MADLEHYDARELESRLYAWWLERGFFEAGRRPDRPPFSIVMPPPNVTGVLHIGHALNTTIQDVLTRMKRMQGYDALWLPGMDHAGISTQTRVEAELRKSEGLTRHDLGRDAFVARVWEWKQQYGGTIRSQLQRLGASCDFARERFTFDEGLSAAVREVFVRLYEQGLIYRGRRVINWCPRCVTALSDIEVVHEEHDGALYHIRYDFADGDGFLTVATTRPETLFADTAVAVHPDDERYAHAIGRMVRLPVVDRLVPVIADAYVDPEFGTGALKITPAHDPNDYEVGVRHGLSMPSALAQDGTLTDLAGPFAGLDRFVARERVAAELQARGILHVTPHSHSVGHCERCDTVVEPWLSLQWFVRMEPLAQPALAAVRDGRVRFVPERFERTYSHWLENVRDWCISRQLWWGHRIPVFYCEACGAQTAAREDITVCPACNSTYVRQDEDVLDTWFSSALWPFSTMGWPDDTPDYERFFPTSVLSTGFDIIPFWVTRMVFTSLHFTGREPFADVLIHGLVRDAQGRKFSKSLGNGVDPMDVIDSYSADALRFMLMTTVAVGTDMRFAYERVDAAQSLVTKVWNAGRFVATNTAGAKPDDLPARGARQLPDRYILQRLSEAAQSVTAHLKAYEFGEAGMAVYEFIWGELCDWYIEFAKVSLYGDDDAAARTTRSVLLFVFDRALRLLHPFMPFATEAIWQALPHDGETITLADWPESSQEWEDAEAIADMHVVMDVIRAVRATRNEMQVPLSRPVELLICPESERLSAVRAMAAHITRLCNPGRLVIAPDLEPPALRVSHVLAGAQVYLPLAGLVDRKAEQERLNKELRELDGEVERLDRKLANAEFVAKAPAAVVQGERDKRSGYEDRRMRVRAELAQLQEVARGQEDE
ncbi:MAG: valine--tRNA ligase [Firmicutes bacterium]|nr:valine--tRNA ligase [Bacillota bacterium]